MSGATPDAPAETDTGDATEPDAYEMEAEGVAAGDADAIDSPPDGMVASPPEAAADAAQVDSALPGTCSDHLTDGDETGLDCGGSCPPCGRGEGCRVDADCSATAPGCDVALGGCACDAVAKTCSADSCADHTRDGDESATDCGGSKCPRCPIDQACLADRDCLSGGCDAVTRTCTSTACADHAQDGVETDVDCGGGVCPGCALGGGCYGDSDCASEACDAVSLTCVADPCADRREDGDETDVDCGGTTCAPCPTGDGCLAASDCVTDKCSNTTRECQ